MSRSIQGAWCIFLLSLLPLTLLSQQTADPLSYYLQLAAADRPQLSVYELSPPSTGAIQRAVDEQPILFALPISLDLNLTNSGQWYELPNGDRVWWIQLSATGAEALGVLYQHMYLPPGSRLTMFHPVHEEITGTYTQKDVPPTHRFQTGFLDGEQCVLEYYEPLAFRDRGRLEIFRADYAFLDPEEQSQRLLNFGFGAADPCNININCPEGANWQDEKRGVCRVQMTLVEGTGWCSGSLLNNTLEDGTPYILSGFHCQDGFTPMYDLWRFDFNYEGPECVNPGVEPDFDSVLGCMMRSGYQASDFLLVEATAPIPADYNVYFNGWDRNDGVPGTATHIHHPAADIRKIAVDTQAAVIHPVPINWNNGVTTPPDHHFRVVFDHGTFEPGSSGGPLFSTAGLVVGQLHGGVIGCDQVLTYHGRLFQSWTGGGTNDSRLSDWLDPDNSGVLTLPGTYGPGGAPLADLGGRVATLDGSGIAGVMVVLSGAVQDTLLTDTTGTYVFTDLPIGMDYVITPIKDTDADNGVTTLDMVDIRKDILNLDPLDHPLDFISADANNTSSVSTLDMVDIQKVILQLETQFPSNTSWRFVDADHVLPLPPGNYPEAISISNLDQDQNDLDFIGTKIGDVNNTSNPYN
jgi:lysyl endopeptidase